MTTRVAVFDEPKSRNRMNPKSLLKTLVVLALTVIVGRQAQAHPYASGLTGTNGSGDVSFVMNEAGATVTVIFSDDFSTLNLGVLAKGSNYFHLGLHTSYSIRCYKQGDGTPSVISTDTDTYSTWNSSRGVAVNKNVVIGTNFGRLCVG